MSFEGDTPGRRNGKLVTCNYIYELEAAGRRDELNTFKEAIKCTAKVLIESGADILLRNDVHLALWGHLEYDLMGTLRGGPYFR